MSSAAFTQAPERPVLALVPDPMPTPRTSLEIDPEVADLLNRCADSAGMSVSTLLQTMLAAQAPQPVIGDLVRCARRGDSVFRVARISSDGSLFLASAQGLHDFGSVLTAGWTPRLDVRRLDK